MAVSEENAPFIEPYAKAGNAKGFRSKGPTAEACKRALAHLGFMPWGEFDQHWNEKVSDAAAKWKRKRGLIPESSNDGSWGKQAHDVMRSAWFGEDKSPAFDGGCQKLLKEEKRSQQPDTKVPNLGSMWDGGLSVLDQDCTHPTGGIPDYPAFDDCFHAGKTIIAPEDMKITQASSSNPGDACYARGESGIEYWFGHMVTAPSVGVQIKKGGRIGTVLDHNVGGGPHVHVGVDTRPLTGKTLKHHDDYTHGAPTIGEQLAAELD